MMLKQGLCGYYLQSQDKHLALRLTDAYRELMAARYEVTQARRSLSARVSLCAAKAQFSAIAFAFIGAAMPEEESCKSA